MLLLILAWIGGIVVGYLFVGFFVIMSLMFLVPFWAMSANIQGLVEQIILWPLVIRDLIKYGV